MQRKDFIKRSGLLGLSAALPFNISCTQSSSYQSSGPLIKPNRITFSSTLGLVAPASPIYEQSIFEKMIRDLRDLGFRIKRGKYIDSQYGYLAGKDRERAEDLMNMFTDPEVEAIMCIRGGWGSNRILEYLDFQAIRDNPKPLIGFSDITSLHLAIQKKSGLITYHGPVGKSEWTEFTKDSFRSVMIDAEKASYRLIDDDLNVINKGIAEAPLLGGNLSVLCSMIGSGYLPDMNGAILFLEDIGESIYRVDRMLMQLEMNGILDQINGFVFGKCTECNSGPNSLSLQEVLDHYLKGKNIPAFYGAMISHEDDNATIPVGIRAQIDASEGRIELQEPAVQ